MKYHALISDLKMSEIRMKFSATVVLKKFQKVYGFEYQCLSYSATAEAAARRSICSLFRLTVTPNIREKV